MIGDWVFIGLCVMLSIVGYFVEFVEWFDFIMYVLIVIEDDVWIGVVVIVIFGVMIGCGLVVGVGVVVAKDVLLMSVVMVMSAIECWRLGN